MKKIAWYLECAERYGDQLKKADGSFVTTRDAARIIGRPKSTAAEFMAWFREFSPATTEALSISDKAKTWVEEDLIYTDLGSDYGVIAFTQGEFRSIRRDYSKHYGGGSVSQTELAIRYRFPSAHAFDVFRRIHQLRQNSIPFTDTELEEEGEDALVEKAITSKRQAFHLKLQEREREQEKRDAEKWRAFEVNAQAIAQHVRSVAADPSVPRWAHRPAEENALLINMQDIHYGKLAHDASGRRVYDRAEASRRSLAALDDLLGQAQASGTPEKIFLVVGGDFLHHDNFMSTTTRGTPQGAQSDGNYREILSEGVALAIEMIKTARRVAETHVLVVHGNHDAQSTLFLGMLLEQAFQGDSAVTVIAQPDGSAFVTYGENSIMVLHGENLKEKDVYRVIVNAAEEHCQVIKKSKLVFTGHVHHERMIDLNGVKLHVCPSLSEADDWHRKSHYTGAGMEAQAFLIRHSGGKAAVFYTSPEIVMTPRPKGRGFSGQQAP